MPDTELLPKSKPEPEPVRRLEVFTGTGRRRQWTAEQKARIVAESDTGGESICAVARRHGLTPQQLFGWRRQARCRADAKSADGGSVFAPVIVQGVRPCADMALAAGRPGGSPAIEIVIGAATVRVSPGIDPASLAAVLRVVRAVT
jgi:transposase